MSNRIFKLNLIDHTLIVVRELYNRDREPIQVLPINESKMIVIYNNYREKCGFALYDIKKGILVDYRPSIIYKYLPSIYQMMVSQRVVTVPYSYTPCLQHVDRNYSAINLIIGSDEYPFQLEINSYTGKMEIYPVRTDLILCFQDAICRISDNELFIFRSEYSTKEALIYNLNNRTYRNVHDPLISLQRPHMCYFKKSIYVIGKKTDSDYCIQTQRYNLLTHKWKFTGKINFKGFLDKLIVCQSRLYAIGRKQREDQVFICGFNEVKNCWGFCNFPNSNFSLDISSQYYSDDLILYSKSGKENEIYRYNISKGDLAMPPALIGKQKSIKFQFGIINIADTYIRFGRNDEYYSLELQCLDHRRDEEIATHGLKNINWTDFQIKFDQIAKDFIFNSYSDIAYAFPIYNKKEIEN